jgi:starch synthase (maltosyl-transferring)
LLPILHADTGAPSSRRSKPRSAERGGAPARGAGPTQKSRSHTQAQITAPRAYYIPPLLVGALPRWERVLDDCAAMRFDTVLIAPPFAVGPMHDPFTAGDYACSHPALEWESDATAALASLAELCAARGLALALDLVLDACAAGNPDVSARPELYALRATAEAEPPDPRRPSATQTTALARFDDSAAREMLLEIWTPRLQRWIDAGVAGFRCLAPQRTPPAVWRALIAHAREGGRAVHFGAWTPGLHAEEVAALAECGFDAAYSSLPWWNFRAGWMLEEDERLRRAGAIIGPVEEPFGARLAGVYDDAARYRCAATRLLEFAAAIEDGLLVPIGFEHGARRPLPRCDASPEDVTKLREGIADLRDAVTRANAELAGRDAARARRARDLVGPGSGALAWLVEEADPASDAPARLLLANPDLDRVVGASADTLLAGAGRRQRFVPLDGDRGTSIMAGTTVTLEPGEVRVLRAESSTPIRAAAARGDAAIAAAARAPRIAFERPSPCVDDERFAVKRVVGDSVHVEIDAFADSHDALAVELLWRAADERAWRRTRMRAIGNDRWAAEFPLERLGRHVYTVRAWRDEFATYRRDAEKKLSADALTPLDIEEGCRMVAAAATRVRGAAGAPLRTFAARLRELDEAGRVALLLDAELSTAMMRADGKPFFAEYPAKIPVDAERRAARFASWYELFPRSQAESSARHGTFDDVIARLPAIRDMGFDVLYMPPIHPIGRANRKGRNNTLSAAPVDPGSPYAIGSEEGGHDAIHSELGTFEDFARLRDAAAKLGIEIALDFAIQCSPDHPWLAQHPDWFAWRADGSVRHAENPPKKYEDIVNVDFYAKGAVPSLWKALRDVVLFWVAHGVRLFRVDNPHTKPFTFWEWMIADVRARHPDVAFLSEAFTRPKPMYRLAKLGFSQSYTYFTWRHSKAELTQYFTELTRTEVREYFRPHLFVNTPDINPFFLQASGRAGFLIRAALATTLSGLWGMYSGFELCESAALPGREEYLDSEKYEIKPRDWNAPGNIIAEIARLNAIRRLNPALQDHLDLEFYNAFNDRILYFGKATAERENAILVAICLDPHAAQEADFEIPLWEWDLPDHAALEYEDLVRGTRGVWRGKVQHMRLDPGELPYAIWRVRPEDRAWT